MRLRIFRPGIMAVVGRDQFDARFPAEPHQSCVDRTLQLDPVVLQLKIKIVRPEYISVAERCLLCFFIQTASQIPCHFACQTGGACDDPLMVLPQCFQIHAGLIIKTVHKSCGNDLHKIGIPLIVLSQQDQMIIAVFILTVLPFKAGTRRNIDLTAQYRLYALLQRLFIKVDHAVHDSVVSDGKRSLSQLLCTRNKLADP